MLKIWLPLKKDRRNIGLSEECREFKKTNMVIRTTGSPIDNKSCGYGYGLYHMEADDFDNDFTVATWIKKEGPWSKTNTIISCKNISASNVYQWYMSIFSSDTQTGMRFQINNGGEWGSYNFLTNTWYHVAGTYNSTTHEYAIYVNGEAIKTGTSTRAKTTGCTNIGVNCRANDAIASGTPVAENNVIADFRIYSHALKDWEIKDLYNCKVIGINGGMYLEETTNIVSNIPSAGENNVAYDVATWATTVTSVKNKNGIYTFSAYIVNTSDHPLNCRLSCYNSAGTGYNALQGNSIPSGSEGRSVVTCDTTNTSKFNGTIYLYIQNGKGGVDPSNKRFYLREVQFEEKDHATPLSFGHRDSRIVDLTDFNQNDITPYSLVKSGSSLYFNGVDSAIKIPMHEMISGGTWSINLWFYRPNGEFGTKTWETLVGGPSGFELEATSSSTKTLYVCPYSWGGGKFAYEADRWNMVTLTRTSSGSKLYINGSLVKSGSAGSMPSGDYFIGAWKTATQQNFKGYIKKFSVFKKCLSDDDVMSLYIHGK